ncbi:MAG: phage holin family protein [Lutimonas sp.]|jgi:putative membrane protein
MKLILKFLLSALAVLILEYILKPHITVDSITTALILAVVLSLLYGLLKPLLVILTLPITILTLGLFLLVINAVIILIASKLISGFHVDGFWWAMLFSILLSITQSFLYKIIEK